MASSSVCQWQPQLLRLRLLLPASRGGVQTTTQTRCAFLKPDLISSFNPQRALSFDSKKSQFRRCGVTWCSSPSDDSGREDPDESSKKFALSIHKGVIPTLVIGKDGKLTLKSRSEPGDGLDVGEEPKLDGYSDGKASSTTERGVPKWKGGSASRQKDPKNPSPAPKYSKAARRFYNEKFRKSERLAKVLARVGVASRRACEDVIFSGRVTVNGQLCKTPQTQVDVGTDEILVDGKPIPKKEPPKFYFAVNKPKGYICSTVSEKQKPVLSLVDEYLDVWMKRNPSLPKPRLFTVGRLDVATTGLIFITNDGDFAQKVGHPSSGLTKEYIATVEQKITKRQLATMSEGTIVDGVKCVPELVEIMENNGTKELYKLRITVSEGRNHEVRNIVENAGLSVKALKRVRIGGFRLPNSLVLGKYQVLKPPQIEQILGSKLEL